jgi:hypothetical protein
MRISNLENHHTSFSNSASLQEDEDLEAPEPDNDTISILVGNKFDRSDVVEKEQLASQPPNPAIQLHILAIQPPNLVSQPSTSAS